MGIDFVYLLYKIQKTTNMKLQTLLIFLFFANFFCPKAVFCQKMQTVRQDTAQTYTVQKGDNLSRISQKFGKKMPDLMKWNSLETAENIKIGQKIWLIEPPTKLSVISSPQPKPTNQDLSYLDAEIRKEKPKKGVTRQAGMAEMIPDTDSNLKLALHKSAPAGTYLRVYNEGTRRGVTVKVIGKLPAIDIEKSILVKLSRSACQSLGAVNQHFPVIVLFEKK